MRAAAGRGGPPCGEPVKAESLWLLSGAQLEAAGSGSHTSLQPSVRQPSPPRSGGQRVGGMLSRVSALRRRLCLATAPAQPGRALFAPAQSGVAALRCLLGGAVQRVESQGFGLRLTRVGQTWRVPGTSCPQWRSVGTKTSKKIRSNTNVLIRLVQCGVRRRGQTTTILSCLNSLLGNIKQNPSTQSLSQTGKRGALGPRAGLSQF